MCYLFLFDVFIINILFGLAMLWAYDSKLFESTMAFALESVYMSYCASNIKRRYIK